MSELKRVLISMLCLKINVSIILYIFNNYTKENNDNVFRQVEFMKERLNQVIVSTV